MTQIRRTPNPAQIALNFLLFIILISTGTAWAKNKGTARASKEKRPAARQQSARNDRSARAQKEREKQSARAERGRGKSAQEARVDKRHDRNSARDLRAARKDRDEERRGGGRALSKRERLAEARRAAEQRRREIAEARRRAELARQAAIARQRAIEQGMRDEAMSNIAKDDTTGEDLEVRRAAVAALGNHAGTVVVMDPKTGRVYTVVNQEWALRRGFKPCSTIKLMTGLAGLTEKVISPVQDVSVSDRHALDLTDALAYSNNGYFQNVGGKVGFDRLMIYARELGLGERTGINHPNESPGRVPLFKSGYAVNHMCSHGDDFEVTPIQLANLVSAIGNGGNLLVPHLPRTPQEDVKFKTIVRRKLNIPQEAIRQMIPGMIGSVNYGSGKKAYDPLQTIAGKTGTCIDRDRQWIGLFTSVAPIQSPQLAVVVVAKGSDGRGHFPAYVAGQIYKSLRHRFGPGPDAQPYAAMPIAPRPKINSKEAAAISDEDKEDEAGDVGETNVTDTLPSGTRPTGNGVKSTIMTVPQSTPAQVNTRPVVPNSTQTTDQQNTQRPRRVHTTRP
jgi:penicillin-binding protein 2